MGKRKFTAKLSTDSLDNLKQELLQYKNMELPNKCRELIKRLMESGVEVANAKLSESPLGSQVTITTTMSSENYGGKGIILAKGAVHQAEGYDPFSILLAIEFGAGVHYNPSGTPNPKSAELGFGVSTFPGQTHAWQDTWFYWDDKEQEWKPSHGIKAIMPMYSADMEIIQNIEKIAKEVFG